MFFERMTDHVARLKIKRVRGQIKRPFVSF